MRAALRRVRPGRADRGVSVVEFAIIMPAFLILLFLLIQAGLYYHAVNVSQAIAQTTARQVRSYDGVPGQTRRDLPAGCALSGEAQRVATETWEALDANKTASAPTATACMADLNQVEVVIQTHSVNLLPGILPNLDITARAQGPVEIFKDQGTD